MMVFPCHFQNVATNLSDRLLYIDASFGIEPPLEKAKGPIRAPSSVRKGFESVTHERVRDHAIDTDSKRQHLITDLLQVTFVKIHFATLMPT